MNEQDYIQIESYLQGELPPEDGRSLEQRAATDSEFGAALALRKKFQAHLSAKASEPALKTSLEYLGQQYFREEERAASVRQLNAPNRRWLRIVSAAAVALLFVVGAALLWPDQGNTYEQFAQHQPLSLTERGSGTDVATQAETAFNNQEYTKASGLLEAYLLEQANDDRAKLALGISLLESNKDSAAIVVFKEISSSDSSIAAYGNWYLALAAVKRGDKAAALRFLELLPSSDTFLQERAKQLRATL